MSHLATEVRYCLLWNLLVVHPEVVNSLPYRGAYILLGRKGMRPGDGLELRAPTGGDATAHISTSVEFVNGVMMGLAPPAV